jgi:VanZ family protein
MLKYLEKHRIIPLILVLLLAAEIFYFSSIKSFPQPPVKEINFAIIYHIIVFFLFTFFLIITIKGEDKFMPKYLFWTLLIAIVYAASDEIHQLFVPERFPSVKDVLIDLIGILFAILIYPKKRNYKTRKNKKSNKSDFKAI